MFVALGDGVLEGGDLVSVLGGAGFYALSVLVLVIVLLLSFDDFELFLEMPDLDLHIMLVLLILPDLILEFRQNELILFLFQIRNRRRLLHLMQLVHSLFHLFQHVLNRIHITLQHLAALLDLLEPGLLQIAQALQGEEGGVWGGFVLWGG